VYGLVSTKGRQDINERGLLALLSFDVRKKIAYPLTASRAHLPRGLSRKAASGHPSGDVSYR